MDKLKETLKKIFTIKKKVVKDEIEEIKNLEITEEDEKQAKMLTVVVIVALNEMGIPVTAIGAKVIETAISYGLRNLKDGIEAPEKLLIGRIINEVKKSNTYKYN